MQKADAQNDYYAANARAAQQAAVNEYAALGHKQVQERDAASRDMFNNQVEALRARGTNITGAGEAGVTGLSVDALIGDLFAQEGRRQEAVDAQYQMTSDAIRADMDNVQSRATARINSVQRAASPSPLPYLIQAASGGLNAYTTYYGKGAATR